MHYDGKGDPNESEKYKTFSVLRNNNNDSGTLVPLVTLYLRGSMMNNNTWKQDYGSETAWKQKDCWSAFD